MNLDKLEASIKVGRLLIVVTLIALPCVYFSWFYLVNGYELSNKSNVWGEFGDFLGGVLNPLIAIFAVYWLTVSVLIQKQELSETRESLTEAKNAQIEHAKIALIAAKIETYNSRLSIINAEFSAKLSLRNVILQTNQPKYGMLNENGTQISAEDMLKKINPEIDNLKIEQNEIIESIRALLEKT